MATRTMKPPFPYPVAFCWLKGKEISKQEILDKGCKDPEKQADGTCKHFQAYGKRQAN